MIIDNLQNNEQKQEYKNKQINTNKNLIIYIYGIKKNCKPISNINQNIRCKNK